MPVDIDKDHEVLILPMLTTPISGLSSGSPSALNIQTHALQYGLVSMAVFG